MNRTGKYSAALALFAGAAIGQTNRGGITGTVFDQTGAIVPNAAVTVISLGTNQETKVKTTEAGTYNALSLEPVSYRVTVVAEGFKKSTVENINVDTATVVTVNVTLQTGRSEEHTSD